MSKLKIKTRGISMEVVGKDDLIQREREAFLEYAENHKGIQIGVTAIPVERLRPFPEHMNCKCSCDSEEPATEAEDKQEGSIDFIRTVKQHRKMNWEELAEKNFIDMVEIIRNPEIKIGLFYVMECFNLGFAEMEWGTCRMVMLKDGKDGKPLNYEEITSREIDTDKLRKHMENLNNGILPGTDKKPKEVEEKEFGWLSPTGEFTESLFGEHEESAEEICEKKGFETEYRAWRKENLGTGEMRLYRDFLAQVKGYCLIHNPSGTGGYIVTNIKELTKKQREFLFDYFMDMGDRFKAEQFWEE